MKNFVLKSLATFVMALFVVSASFASKTVYYIYDAGRTDPATGQSPEKPVADAIADKLGYTVTMFGTIQLENATAEQLDELRAADLIIIGRAVGSWNWTPAGRAIWNTLKTPVLSTNAFAIQGARLRWFELAPMFGGEAGVEQIATVNMPEDPIFEGIDLGDDNEFALWVGGWTCIAGDLEFPGNEQVMISTPIGSDLAVFFARFEPNVDFFEDLDANAPAGPRSYMGMGADGGDVYNYWGWTEAGQTIFLREVERLASLAPTSIRSNKLQLNASVYPNPAVSNLTVKMNNLSKVEILDLTGKLIYSANANGQELNVDISALKAGVYFVKAVDSNNNSSVTIVMKK